jgi:predicted nucleic acid-binding protein
MNQPDLAMIDSNIPMYAAGQEHHYRLPCRRVLEQILNGELNAATNVEVHQEILHRYLALGQPDRAREVSEDFQALVPNVLPVTIQELMRSRELSIKYPGLPSRDLVHLAVMLSNGIDTIVSADRHFDNLSEIKRLDPMQLGAL